MKPRAEAVQPRRRGRPRPLKLVAGSGCQQPLRLLGTLWALFLLCCATPSTTSSAKPVEDPQQRYSAAVARCQQQFSDMAADAARASESRSGPDRFLVACTEKARSDLEVKAADSQR